jgi:hypothetical protein
VSGALWVLLGAVGGYAWWNVMQARDHDLGLQDGWVDDLAHTITDEALLETAYQRGDFPVWAEEMRRP